jgi:hypothetical protein
VRLGEVRALVEVAGLKEEGNPVQLKVQGELWVGLAVLLDEGIGSGFDVARPDKPVGSCRVGNEFQGDGYVSERG